MLEIPGRDVTIEDTAAFHYCRGLHLLDEGRPAEALEHAEAALEIQPEHVQSLVLAAAVYTFQGKELGLGIDVSSRAALNCYERALAVEPELAEAWSGKAFLLLRLDRPEEALAAADCGLAALTHPVGPDMDDPEVQVKIAENLFSNKIRALLAIGRKDEARQALSDGFEHCPQSEYLTRHLKWFLPER